MKGGLIGFAACGAGLVIAATAAAAKDPAVTLERIAGSTVKRVILAPKAAERLGIELGKVSEATIARKQMVAGLVIPPLDGQAQPAQAGGVFRFSPVSAAAAPPTVAKAVPADDRAWLQVTLSPAEWERLAKDKPARVLPLATRERFGAEIFARPSGMPPIEDTKRSMLNVYYVVPGKDAALALNKRMRVELPLTGNEARHKVVAYSAVYYDARGGAWTYVNTAPLTFERQRIRVERIEGELALLNEGPPIGTPVVTIGAALLYGAEIFGK